MAKAEKKTKAVTKTKPVKQVKTKAAAEPAKKKATKEKEKKPAKSKKAAEIKVKTKQKSTGSKTKKDAPKDSLMPSKDILFSRNKTTANKEGSWELGDLKGAEYNPRTITAKGLSNLDKSITEFGDLSGVVMNRFTGRLISGHQRVETIKLNDYPTKIKTKKTKDKHGTVEEGYIEYKTPKGVIKVPYRVVDWSDMQTELAANIAANAQGGVFDNRKLGLMTALLYEGAYKDMELTGLDITTIKSLPKLDDLGTDASGKSSPGKSFQTFDSDEVEEELVHTCPQCQFRFKDQN